MLERLTQDPGAGDSHLTFLVGPQGPKSLDHRSIRGIRMPKRQRPGPPESPIPLRARIIAWLQESGNYLATQTLPGMEFAIQGTYPRPDPGAASLGFFVLKPDTESRIILLANVGLSNEHRAALAAQTPDQRAKFVREIQLALLFRCNYQFQQAPTTQELVTIQLAKEIYYDDQPTRKDVYDSMGALYAGYLYISIRLGELPPTAYVAR